MMLQCTVIKAQIQFEIIGLRLFAHFLFAVHIVIKIGMIAV